MRFVSQNFHVLSVMMDTFWLPWMQVEQEHAKFVTLHVKLVQVLQPFVHHAQLASSYKDQNVFL